MVEEFGDPESDLDAAIADQELREVLTRISVEPAVVDPAGTDRAAVIEELIARAWPDGYPPTVDELAADPEFAGVADVPDDADPDDSMGTPAGAVHLHPGDDHGHGEATADGDPHGLSGHTPWQDEHPDLGGWGDPGDGHGSC
ncbi:hypothetical protein [Rhodococcus koreensis]|uniref:hypothetical protein n=1 Tax=Rhodococcus koreensis TaxID=99653 RepID=UPI0036DB7BAB